LIFWLQVNRFSLLRHFSAGDAASLSSSILSIIAFCYADIFVALAFRFHASDTISFFSHWLVSFLLMKAALHFFFRFLSRPPATLLPPLAGFSFDNCFHFAAISPAASARYFASAFGWLARLFSPLFRPRH
jgi:hypothetical protein